MASVRHLISLALPPGIRPRTHLAARNAGENEVKKQHCQEQKGRIAAALHRQRCLRDLRRPRGMTVLLS
jgi:hypothetical protein